MSQNGQRRKPPEGLPARRAALSLVSGVLEYGASLSEIETSPPDFWLALTPSDRARAQRLALSVLRHLGQADAVLKPLVRKKPSPDVQQVLRLGVVELALDPGSAHGIVDSAVVLAKQSTRNPRLSGMVNAVLRKVAAEAPEHLSAHAQQRLPGWLRGRLVSAYGNARVAKIEAAHAQAAPLDLTPRNGNAQDLAARVGGEALSTGSVRLVRARQVSALAGYDEGDWWVQDAAAAIPARLCGDVAGLRVLDLCAAPGGKTMQLAAAQAAITAVDHSAPRMERLRENLERARLSAEVVTADVLEFDATPFDVVLLDAPCTATGTIRRHPDLPFVRTVDQLKSLVALQSEMLVKAIELTRPGGRLVYCTCSLLPEEGEAQVARALEARDDLELDQDATQLPWLDPAFTTDGMLRITPEMWADRGGIDGFFAAVLRKAD